jgi:hypothetical protein
MFRIGYKLISQNKAKISCDTTETDRCIIKKFVTHELLLILYFMQLIKLCNYCYQRKAPDSIALLLYSLLMMARLIKIILHCLRFLIFITFSVALNILLLIKSSVISCSVDCSFNNTSIVFKIVLIVFFSL